MNYSLKKAFEQAAEKNYWSDADSLSGPGSNMVQTAVICKAIPALLQKYQVKSMLDAPCGDLFWMKVILAGLVQKNIQYHGADIVASLVEKHRINYQSFNAIFRTSSLQKSIL